MKKYGFLVFIFLPFLSFADNKEWYEPLNKVYLPAIAIFVSLIILYVTFFNNKKNNFDNKFNLLMQQHDKLHAILIKGISDNVIEYGSIVGNRSCNASVKRLYRHEKYSSYLRVLYHVLKFIDKETPVNFWNLPKTRLIKKKNNSSIIRSVIDNKVMLLVAVNSLNKDFYYYRHIINKFSFFEHVSFFSIYQFDSYNKDCFCIFNKTYFIKAIYTFSLRYINSKALNFPCGELSLDKFYPHWSMYVDMLKRDGGYYNSQGIHSFYHNISLYIMESLNQVFDKIQNATKVPDIPYRVIASIHYDSPEGERISCLDFVSIMHYSLREFCITEKTPFAFKQQVEYYFEKNISKIKYVNPTVRLVAFCDSSYDILQTLSERDRYIDYKSFFNSLVKSCEIEYVSRVTKEKIAKEITEIVNGKIKETIEEFSVLLNRDILNKKI